MGIELIIVEELANINVTLTELSSITRIVNSQIKSNDFDKVFNKMIDEIAKSYDVVISNLQTFYELDSEASFVADFDSLHAAYTARYLKEVSKPRTYTDEAYEEYLILKNLKQSKTSYPLLKRTFERLDLFIDKWVTNDAWLAMNIDILFKRLQQLLNEVAEVKKKDSGDAFIIYNSALVDFDDNIALIRKNHDLLMLRNNYSTLQKVL